jgi:hypothetical protein
MTTPLIHDLELHAPVLARGAGADDGAESPSDPPLAADHLAAVRLGHVEPQDKEAVLLDLLDPHSLGVVDEAPG